MTSRDRVIIIVYPYVTIEVPSVGQVPYIGHAGVMLIKGSSGLTKYYEYGRYDPQALGIVKNKVIPNVSMDVTGEPTNSSLKKAFRSISEQSGKKTEVKSVSYLTPDTFEKGLQYCETRHALNADPNRQPYDVLTNNCVSFADQTARTMLDALTQIAAMPIFNPVPHTYILALQFNSLVIPDAHYFDYDYNTDIMV